PVVAQRRPDDVRGDRGDVGGELLPRREVLHDLVAAAVVQRAPLEGIPRLAGAADRLAAAGDKAVVQDDYPNAGGEPVPQTAEEPRQVGTWNVRPEESDERRVELTGHPVERVGIGLGEAHPARRVLPGARDGEGPQVDVGGRDRGRRGGQGVRPVPGAGGYLSTRRPATSGGSSRCSRARSSCRSGL